MGRGRQIIWIVIFLVAAGAVVLGYRVVLPGESTVIRNRLNALGRTISVEPDQGRLAKIAGTASLEEDFAPEVMLRYYWRGQKIDRQFQRKELVSQVRGTLLSLDRLKIHLHDIKVEIEPDTRLAYVYFTAVVDLNDQEAVAVQEMEATWVKLEGRWRIRALKTIETFRI